MNGSLPNNSSYSPVHYELLNRLGDDAPPSSTFITSPVSSSPLVNHTPYHRNDHER